MSPYPERYVLDSNIFDKIVDTSRAQALIERLVSENKIQLVSTHIQEDELTAIPDKSRRDAIARIPRVLEPTYGFVLDVSRLGMARLGDAAPIEAIRGSNWQKYTHDALIAATAEYDGLTLVTEERRLTNRARRELGASVLDWRAFYAHLQSL